jgi:hypothetical protein
VLLCFEICTDRYFRGFVSLILAEVTHEIEGNIIGNFYSHFIFSTRTSYVMLSRGIIICSENHKKFINTFRRKDENCLNVEVGGAYSYHCSLKAVLCMNMYTVALCYFRIFCLHEIIWLFNVDVALIYLANKQVLHFLACELKPNT